MDINKIQTMEPYIIYMCLLRANVCLLRESRDNYCIEQVSIHIESNTHFLNIWYMYTQGCYIKSIEEYITLL